MKKRTRATTEAMEGLEDVLAVLSSVAERIKAARLANAGNRPAEVERELATAVRKLGKVREYESRRWFQKYWNPYTKGVNDNDVPELRESDSRSQRGGVQEHRPDGRGEAVAG